MAETPRGLSLTPPAGLSATPPGLSATPPAGLRMTPPDETRLISLRGLDDRGKTLIGDTGFAPLDYVTEKVGQLGYAAADNIIGFDDGVDTFGERLGEGVGNVALGVGSGVTKAIEGAGTTLALAPDIILGTEYGDAITEGMETFRDDVGLKPEGILGKGAEIITQFVVPGGLAAKAVSYASKANRLKKGLQNVPLSTKERFGLATKELLAAGAADGFVSDDNMTTLADWAEMGPTQTYDLIGLSGREKALARLSNKLKVGAEGFLLGGVAQGALMGAGKTVGGAIKSPVGQMGAKALKKKIDTTAANVDNLLYQRMMAPDELSRVQRFKADAISMVTPKGYLPQSASETRLAIDAQTNAANKQVAFMQKEYDTALDNLFKDLPPKELEGNLERLEILNRSNAYLTEADETIKAGLLKQLPGPLRPSLKKYREAIDNGSAKLRNSNFIKNNNITTKDGRSLDDIINDNDGSYMKRSYRIHEDKDYVPTQESTEMADDFFVSNKRATQRELTELARRDVNKSMLTDEFLDANGLTLKNTPEGPIVEVGSKVTAGAAKKARESFLSKHTIKARQSFKGGRIARDRLDTGMLVSREQIPKTLRALMGETGTKVVKTDQGLKVFTDFRESALRTVSDLAQFSAVDEFFGSLSRLAGSKTGLLKDVIIKGEGLSPAQRAELINRGYVRLGGDSSDFGELSTPLAARKGTSKASEEEVLLGTSGWGTLNDHYVPRPIYNNLTNHIIGEEDMGSQLARSTWNWMLRAKGVSQYSKTILSPITQVRNFTTAAAFALANGNVPFIGRGGSMKDSMKLVYGNLMTKGDDDLIAELMDAQQRGMLGTNAELREIQDSLRKGVGMTSRGPESGIEALIAGSPSREKFAKAAGGYLKPLENIYQSSDDFWKHYNYVAEQAHIRKSLDGMDFSNAQQAEQAVAYLTKNGEDMSEATRLSVNNGTFAKADIDEMIKHRAAQIVRDTVPNYNKGATDLVRFGRRLPLGNFITFPAEIYRTGFNIVRQSLDDMASDIPAVQTRGRNRMIGFLGTTIAAPVAVQEMGYAISGVTPEEMEAYQRSFAAPWEKGATLIPIGKKDGKIQYLNFSTSNPYDGLYRFAVRAMNEFEGAVKEGQGPGSTFTSTVGGAVGEIFSPFLSEAMLTEAVTDVLFRGGRTSTGAEVYNKQDSDGTKGYKMITHVLNTMVPSVSPVDLDGEPGRFIRGTVGNIVPGLVSPKDKLLRERNLTTEVIRAFSGLSPLEFDPARGLEYGAYRLGQAQTDAKRMFNQVTDDGNASSTSLERAYQKSNDAKLRVDRQYYQMVEDLDTMGMTKREIMTVLKKNNIGGYKDIVRGEFQPFMPSKKNFQEMRDAGILELYPREEIRQIQKEMRGTSLKPDDDLFTDTRPRGSAPAGLSPNPPTGLSPTPPAGLSPTPPAGLSLTPPQREGSLPQPAPTITQASATGPVNPALLGGTPAERAANAFLQG